MSQEKNVELVRQSYEAWNRGDLEWVLDHITPDYEWRTAQLVPDTEAVYRGREGFRQFWNTFREPWETLLIEVERSSQSATIAYLHCSGSGAGGGTGSR